MTGISIGSLRHRILLEQPVRAATEGGAASIDWSSVAEVSAKILPQRGQEIFDSDQFSGRVTHRITLRYRAGVTPEMRFRLGARILEILSVRNVDERGRWLECDCEERTP